jgi:hypothetical protein
MIARNLTQLLVFWFWRLLGHSVLLLKWLSSAGVPTYEYGIGLHGSNNPGRTYPILDMQIEVYKLILEIGIQNT